MAYTALPHNPKASHNPTWLMMHCHKTANPHSNIPSARLWQAAYHHRALPPQGVHTSLQGAVDTQPCLDAPNQPLALNSTLQMLAYVYAWACSEKQVLTQSQPRPDTIHCCAQSTSIQMQAVGSHLTGKTATKEPRTLLTHMAGRDTACVCVDSVTGDSTWHTRSPCM